jgi:uncharacterized repeat protein (TIGR03803 family)
MEPPPQGNLVFDAAGNLYGTTLIGGVYGAGAVYELTPQAGEGWAETVLHSFRNDGKDGEDPEGGLIFDVAGNLYGTTFAGGAHSFGIAFQLKRSKGSGWTENILHTFNDNGDGYYPSAGLIFDRPGNLYGTAAGGPLGSGIAFRLEPGANGQWTETIL